MVSVLYFIINLAAEFCWCCNLLMSSSSSPYSKLLQWSSFDVIKAWTSRSTLAWSRYFLTLLMFLRAREAEQHILLYIARHV